MNFGRTGEPVTLSMPSKRLPMFSSPEKRQKITPVLQANLSFNS